ncbi:hypothetical protein [Malonomonas rubra]|uniref:hypothetical protein n=1 Tax=Malonomonas rubra TaxID=57040 RepID=UPI0026EB4F5B|nr:hypothetical protein [Malonomonas rubra]
MELDIVKALFGFYIVVVSLLRLMADNEYFRLTLMKKIWGRSRGLMIHFLSNVVLPMLFAIYFFCRGIAAMTSF